MRLPAAAHACHATYNNSGVGTGNVRRFAHARYASSKELALQPEGLPCYYARAAAGYSQGCCIRVSVSTQLFNTTSKS
jgi:hypothetical protein